MKDLDLSVVYMSNCEPFGPGNCESGSEDYRYTGKHEDPSGLYYFGARYYDPLTGRFTTRDTVFGGLGDPQSQNRYVYCMNNPHKYVDPDGKFAISAFAFSAFTGGLIGSAASMVTYAAVAHVSGHEITANGIVSAGYSGFISGVVSVVAGPLGGSIAKVAGLGSNPLASTGISLGIQAIGDEVAHWVGCEVGQETYDNSMKEKLIRGTYSVGSNIVLGEILPKTGGMKTLDQAEIAIPKTSDAYYGAIFDSTVPNIMNARAIATGIIVGSSLSQMIDPWMDISSYMIDDTVERRRMGG